MRSSRRFTLFAALGIVFSGCGGGDDSTSTVEIITGGAGSTSDTSVGLGTGGNASGGTATGGSSTSAGNASIGGFGTGGIAATGGASTVGGFSSVGSTGSGGATGGISATGSISTTGGAATGGWPSTGGAQGSGGETLGTGGTAPTGGATGGVSAAGGATTGGAATGGPPATGGAATGGAATGGLPATGGAATGGVPPTGGAATGGVPPTGGAATGGVPPTGGAATGGVPPTGGAATGGVPPTGGAATGGLPATGGAATGGLSATGGTVTGGSGGTGGQTVTPAIEGCALTCDDKDDDGDGFSECQGDCNDADATVLPLVADPSATAGGDGTPANPYQTIVAAYNGLGTRTCRAIALRPGTYTDSYNISTGGTFINKVTIASTLGPSATFWQAPATNNILRAYSWLTLRGITFRSATGTSAWGLQYSSTTSYACTNLTVENCIFERLNRAILIDNCGGTMSIRCNVFRNNVTTSDSSYYTGGTIMETDYTGTHNYSIVNNIFDSNTSNGHGAAIALVHPTGLIQGNRFTANSTTRNGGAVWVQSGIMGGDIRIRQNWFGANRAASGAGVYLSVTPANAYIENNVFDANIATGSGGGICLYGSSGGTRRLANNTFVDNQAGLGAHAHLRLWVGDVLANVFAVAWGGGGVSADSWTNSADAPLFTFNDTYLNTPDYAGALTSITITGQNGNVSGVDPQFVGYTMDQNATNDDLHLQSTSALVNAGPCAPPTVWDVDGSCNDPGAYGGPGGNW